MISRALTAASVAIVLSVLATPSLSQALDKEADWDVLTDDASRQVLFEEMIKPVREEEDGTPIDFGIPREFLFPVDAEKDRTKEQVGGDYPARTNVVFGIDISHHTGNIKFATLYEQKVRFVYAKATQGVRFKDGDFGDFWKRLGELPDDRPVYRGAYHFLTAKGSAADQAKSFLAYLKLHGGLEAGDLPPVMDLEWDRSSSNPDQWKGHEDEIIAKTLEWLRLVEEGTGRVPVIYTARSWWKERGLDEADFAQFDRYPIWIADYSKSHKAKEKPFLINDRVQTMWQFADDSQLTSGYRGSLDANIFYGSIDDFRSAFGIPN